MTMLTEAEQSLLKQSGTCLQDILHKESIIAGWWFDLDTEEDLRTAPRIVEQKLCLIHSEISEAMEGYRKDLDDDKLPHRKMIEVELADAAIRIFDLAGAMGLDLGEAISEKAKYNSQREDHKLESRQSEGGKKF